MKMMKRTIIAAILALAALVTSAQEQQKLSASIVVGPYLQAVTETGFTVVWITDVDAAAWVEVAPDDGSHFFACDRPKYYETVLGKRPVGKLHKVRVEGLDKGTVYRYRVMQQALMTKVGEKKVCFGIPSGNDPFRQKPYEVRTLDSSAADCDFSICNDIHGRDSLFRCLFKDARNDSLDFVIFNGDMLSAMDREDQILKGYLSSASELFASYVPFFHARGNHENRGWFSYRFLDYFPTTNGLPYYLVRQGPAAILILDCGEDKPDSDISYSGLILSDEYREQEAEWLEKVIETEEFRSAPVKIAVLHMPSSVGGWHGNREINRLIIPLLEKAGIDLMLSGHIHKYSFSGPGERGCAFPVLINGYNEKHNFHITEDGISAKRIDSDGKVLKEYFFPAK